MSGMKNKWGLSVGVNKSAWGAPESQIVTHLTMKIPQNKRILVIVLEYVQFSQTLSILSKEFLFSKYVFLTH